MYSATQKLLSIANISGPPKEIGITQNDPRFQTIQGLVPSVYLTAALNFILGAAGVASFVFLLWGGVQWVMSGGDKEGLEKARKKVVAALVGLAIVFSSYGTLFIVRTVFGINLIQFDVSQLGNATGESGGSYGDGGSPPSGPGNGNCRHCGVSYCGLTGVTYVGANGIHDCYLCAASGWTFVGGTCTIQDCGTCPSTP